MALKPVDEALAEILAAARLLKTETVAIGKARGRVLAKSVLAKRDQPPFAASAMDGYAVRAADAPAGAELTVSGMSAAGHGYRRKLKPGTTVRIFTGAPLPSGADGIVIQENVERKENRAVVLQSAVAGRHIRERGLDFKSGDLLVPASTRLNVRDIGLIAAAGLSTITVRRKPIIAVLTTGDELVLPGAKPRGDQIFSSNSLAIAALAESWGAAVINLGIVADSVPATARAIAKVKSADILITTGGASVGDHDLVQAALKASGYRIGFWKIAMRPGKPFMFGIKSRQLVLGLPGNPVAAVVCARLFLKPLLSVMNGQTAEPQTAKAILDEALPANDERQDYLRASCGRGPGGAVHVRPATVQDSSMQRTLREANCLIVRKPFAPAAAVGSEVDVLDLDF